MEGQVVLDGGRRLHGLHLQRGANVGERTGAKGERLGVMRLPPLVLRSKVECARVLQIGRQDYRLVASLTGQLDTKIPGIQGDEGELLVFGRDVLGCKSTEAFDGVTEGAGVPDLVPGEGGQARCEEKLG